MRQSRGAGVWVAIAGSDIERYFQLIGTAPDHPVFTCPDPEKAKICPGYDCSPDELTE